MSTPSREFSERFLQLIDLWIDGNINAEDLEELQAQLKGDPAKQKYAAELLLLSEELAIELETSRATRVRRHIAAKRNLMLVGLGALCSIAILILSLPKVETTKPPSSFAFYDRIESAEWPASTVPPTFDSELLPGEPVELLRGFAGITLSNGTRVLAEGPTSLTLADSNTLLLQTGKIVLSLPEGAAPFSIESAGYNIKVASNCDEEAEGNLYGLYYDNARNLLQTSVYSGDVEVQPLPGGGGAELKMIPVHEEVPIAETFLLALNKNPTPAATRIALNLSQKEGGQFSQSLSFSNTFEESHRLKTYYKDHLRNTKVRLKAGEEIIPPDSFGCFEISNSSIELQFLSSEEMNGVGFLFPTKTAMRRSDFLGQWGFSTPVADEDAPSSNVRLRSDGTVVPKVPSQEKSSWYYRAGLIYIIDATGKTADRWLPLDGNHLISEKDQSILIQRL